MKRNRPRTQQEKNALDAYVKLMRAAETVTSGTLRHLSGSRLTISQFGVLEALYHLGPLCQRDIARKILKSTGNMTTVIDNLEKRGLVERRRSTEDRRYVAVHLTEEGQSLIAGIFPPHVEQIVKGMSVLSSEEQQELARLCRKLGLGQGNAG